MLNGETIRSTARSHGPPLTLARHASHGTGATLRTAHAGGRRSPENPVVDYRRERRLIVGGAILSVYPLDGDWSAIEREYWWQGLVTVLFPPRSPRAPRGARRRQQAHLVHRVKTPRLVTAYERDPSSSKSPQRCWAGRAGPMEFYCGDAEDTARRWRAPASVRLRHGGRRLRRPARPLARGRRGVVPLVADGGTLVVNRHHRGDAGARARALRPRFESIRLRRVRREGENVLLFAEGPRASSG